MDFAHRRDHVGVEDVLAGLFKQAAGVLLRQAQHAKGAIVGLGFNLVGVKHLADEFVGCGPNTLSP